MLFLKYLRSLLSKLEVIKRNRSEISKVYLIIFYMVKGENFER